MWLEFLGHNKADPLSWISKPPILDNERHVSTYGKLLASQEQVDWPRVTLGHGYRVEHALTHPFCGGIRLEQNWNGSALSLSESLYSPLHRSRSSKKKILSLPLFLSLNVHLYIYMILFYIYCRSCKRAVHAGYPFCKMVVLAVISHDMFNTKTQPQVVFQRSWSCTVPWPMFFFRRFDGRGFQRTARLRGILVVLVWNDLKELCWQYRTSKSWTYYLLPVIPLGAFCLVPINCCRMSSNRVDVCQRSKLAAHLISHLTMKCPLECGAWKM